MKPDARFANLPRDFWANVRLISQTVGYSERGQNRIKVPKADEITNGLAQLNLSTAHLVDKGSATEFAELLRDYFECRATMLHELAEPNLMDAKEGQRTFKYITKKLKPQCVLPMNKQKGGKKAPAFFTCIINMLIEANCKGYECDYDPRELTVVTRANTPLRTFARRVDGAFPSATDPIAIWEIKEYYYTTTFGSRVADGVYETLLDGMEIEELHVNENVDVKHYLMIDAYYTWWNCGKSYLCRIVDMLHMGYVDEVLVGREVIERLPELVEEWISILERR